MPRVRTTRVAARSSSAPRMISERPSPRSTTARFPDTGEGRPHPRPGQLRDRDPRRAHHPVHHVAARSPRMEGHGQFRVKNGPALAGHGAEAVAMRSATSITSLPDQLRRSLLGPGSLRSLPSTHSASTTGLAIYFCDPRTPLAVAGTNENTNGLHVRQYFREGHRPEQAQRRRPRSRCCCPQHPTPQDPRLENPGRGSQRSSRLVSVQEGPTLERLGAPVAVHDCDRARALRLSATAVARSSRSPIGDCYDCATV